jgi:hypothetical protein
MFPKVPVKCANAARYETDIAVILTEGIVKISLQEIPAKLFKYMLKVH